MQVRDIVIPSGWRQRLEDTNGRRHALIAAGAVVSLVAISAALWARGAPRARVAPPAVAVTPAVPGTAAAATAPSPEVSGFAPLFVHVAGEVRSPGLYRLPAGARAAEAVAAAGGALGRADLDAINLAAVLVDGSKLEVPRKGENVVAAPASTTSPGAPAVVALNSADQAALEGVPGLGPVKAQAIIEYRTRIGAFESISQLLEVSGIGPATLETIRPHLTLQ